MRSPSNRPRKERPSGQASLDDVTLRFLKVASQPTLRKNSDFVDLVASGGASRLHRGLEGDSEEGKDKAPSTRPSSRDGEQAEPLDAAETAMVGAADSDVVVERDDSCAVRFLLHPWAAVFFVIFLPLADLVSDALFYAELRRASGCYGRTAYLRDKTTNGRLLALIALIFGAVAVLIRLYFFRRVWGRIGAAARKDGTSYSFLQRFKATALMYRAVVRSRVDVRARSCGCGAAKLAEFLEGILEGVLEIIAISLVANSFGFTAFAFASYIISLIQVSRVAALYSVEFLCCCCRMGKAQRLLSSAGLALALGFAVLVMSASSDLVSKVVWLEVSSSQLLVVDPVSNMTTVMDVSWCPTGVIGTTISSEPECFFATVEEAEEALEDGEAGAYPFFLDPYHIVLNKTMAQTRDWGLFPEYTRESNNSVYFNPALANSSFFFDDILVDEVSTNLQQQYRGIVTEQENGSMGVVPSRVFSTIAVRLNQVGVAPNLLYSMDITISGHLVYALFGECGRASLYGGPGTPEDRAFADVFLDSTELPRCGSDDPVRRANARVPLCVDQYESSMCGGPVNSSRTRYCPDNLACCSEPGVTIRFDEDNRLRCSGEMSECVTTCRSLVRDIVLSSVVVGENIACNARDVVSSGLME